MACGGRREAKPEFISVHFSPWSIKPKWALKWSEIDVTFTEKPFLETPLRWRLGIKGNEQGAPPTGTDGDGSPTSVTGIPNTAADDGKLTFPILALPDGALLRQSLAIAKWAHMKAKPGKGLGGADPKYWNPTIDEWDAKATKLMNLSRAESFKVAGSDDAKCIEMIRLFGLPIPTDFLKLKVGRMVAQEIQAKYAKESENCSFEENEQFLLEVRKALTFQPSWKLFETTGILAHEGPYLVDGRFTYADISVVLGLHTLRLFENRLPCGMLPAIQSTTVEELASKFPDLYKWAEAVLKVKLPGLD